MTTLTLKDGSTVPVSDLDPAIVAHFAAQEKGLKDKNTDLLASIATLNAFKKAVDDLGGLDILKTLKTTADEKAKEAEDARKKGLSADERLKEVEDTYKRQVQERDDKLAKWQKQSLDDKLDAALADAIRAEGGTPEMLAHALRSRVEATMGDDGKVTITVKGKNGENLDDKGNAFTLKGLVGEFKANDTFAGAFKADAGSGGGGRPSARTPGGVNPFAEATRNVTKQMELIKSSPDVAKALAAAAGVEANW